jgi:hypothetical protein
MLKEIHDGPAASPDVVARFEEVMGGVPAELRTPIREKLHEFAGRALDIPSRRKKFRRAAWQR